MVRFFTRRRSFVILALRGRSFRGDLQPAQGRRLSRTVSLTPELEAFVSRSVETGDYSDAGEVVRAALQTLRDERHRSEAWLVGGGLVGRMEPSPPHRGPALQSFYDRKPDVLAPHVSVLPAGTPLVKTADTVFVPIVQKPKPSSADRADPKQSRMIGSPSDEALR